MQSRTRRTPPWRALALVVSVGPGLAAADHCDDLAGRLVSVEGEVSVADLPARMNDEICSGESVEIGARSRAAVRLEDTQTVVRIDQNSTFLIRPTGAERSWLEMIKGAIYLFSRQPESLRVDTPYVNAMIDGTEFVVEASDASSDLTVIEGSVLVGNALGEVRLAAGETASAGAGQSPSRRVVIDPLDAVQWALHYPPIGASEDTSEAVRAAAERLARGDVASAEPLLLEAPEDAASLALQAMIAVTRHRPADATRLAEQAVNADAGSSLAYTALSYAQQARFEIEQALTSANVAVRNDARNADALARLAELQLGVDDTAGALESARRAIDVAPDNSRAHTVLGFVRLVRLEVDEAQAAFTDAVSRDPGDPLPRLGLGLATIRDGRLVEGREHLEVAAALDPNNALVRSYLGKAYAEEREPADAAAQFALAQTLDPQDPTPWLYDALLDQALNRPVSAYDKITRARALNDNRSIYQSRLLVDKSEAAGSLSLARIYTDLGFEQSAINESTRSIAIDPTNFSAYRFLADSYSDRERHESARQNVLFQAAMLQPMTINPVQHYTQESDLLILPGTNPVHSSINEYSPLFEREGFQLVGSLVAGTDQTLGDNLVFSGLHERFAYSIGQFHYENDGFRLNNDVEHDIYHGFVQVQMLENVFVQAELQERRSERGDLALNFDPDAFSRDLRKKTETSSPRIGLRAEFGARSTLLFSAGIIDRMERASQSIEPLTLFDETDIEGHETSVRLLYRAPRSNHAIGVDSYRVNVESGAEYVPCIESVEPCIFDFGEVSSDHASFHYYVDGTSEPRWGWTLGLSYDFFDDEILAVDEQTLGPKLGLRWQPTDASELRLAISRGRKLPISRRLEPTTLAGFNQIYDDAAGTRYVNVGIAYDRNASSARSHVGMELFNRQLDVLQIDGPRVFEEAQRETTLRGYWNRILHPHLSLGIELLYERFERDDSRDADGDPISSSPLLVETMSLPLGIHYAHPSGVFLQGGVALVRQSVDSVDAGNQGPDPGEGFDEDSERFVNVDASLGMRFPSRRAIVRLDLYNLFDESFLFQDHNIQTREASSPRFSPGRSVVGRVSFSFR